MHRVEDFFVPNLQTFLVFCWCSSCFCLL